MHKNPSLRSIIAGAIYAFAAGLTCRDKPLTLGATHHAGPAAEACDEFLRRHGCNEGEPLVKEWAGHLDAPIGVTPALGLQAIKDAMKADDGYAWGWHCAAATAAMDEGLNHAAANRAAARFMYMAFGIDTSAEPAGGSQDAGKGGDDTIKVHVSWLADQGQASPEAARRAGINLARDVGRALQRNR